MAAHTVTGHATLDGVAYNATGSFTVAAAPPPSGLGFGVYMGQFQQTAVTSAVGKRPDFSTYYYQVSGTTPGALNVAAHKAEIDLGITQVIDLDWKSSTQTIAQVAAGNADGALTTWFANLKTLSDYAVSKANGAQVWFSFVHEAVVHINQNKFTGSGVTPSLATMASAYNHVMGMCQTLAPNAVRTYWFGGMEPSNQGVNFGDQLNPAHIQAVTFDPYRFASHSDTESATATFGGIITALKAKSWFTGKPWGLTEFGTTQDHGDQNNATWLTQAFNLLEANGASIAVYFDRNTDDNYFITDGTTPLSLAAFKAAIA